MRPRHTGTQGFALVAALSLAALLMVILTTYAVVTVNNSRTAASSASSSAGFYAAEAALNVRAEQIRLTFKGFQVPGGTSPGESGACLAGNRGSGDLGCVTSQVAGRRVTSYVVQGSPTPLTIPPGEDFENLSAEETPFTVRGEAVGGSGNPEAITELTFRSRLVPLFQFAVFFDKDLEFTNTANLDLSGPVHTNGNLFLDAGSGATLQLRGQTTAAGTLYRGVKHENGCTGGNVRINRSSDSGDTHQLNCAGGGRRAVTPADLTATRGRLKKVEEVSLPGPEMFAPEPGALYWDRADVRIVLKQSGSSWGVQFVNASRQPLTLTGSGCAAATATAQTLRDNREAQYWEAPNSGRDRNGAADATRATRRTLDLDLRELLTCIGSAGNAAVLGLTDGLANRTDGGLVVYASVDDGPGGIAREGANHYAVRLRNGALLRSSNAAHPRPAGLTVVSDQAVFLQGNYNAAADAAAGWIPAAVMADTVNVLSENWDKATPCRARFGNSTFAMNRALLSNSAGSLSAQGQTWYAYSESAKAETIPGTNDAKSQVPLFCRPAAATTVKAAILANTTTSGGAAGEGQLDVGPQSGGVHNMMRFHEDWGSNDGNQTYPHGAVVYTYSGSLVSLAQPRHAFGQFVLGENRYQPPRRDWAFEEAFRRSENLPPLTPRFVYLKQDNFTRKFER